MSAEKQKRGMDIDRDKLIKYMNKEAYTAEELASAAGVGSATITRIRTGSPARASTVRKICAALHCTPSDIIKE